VFFGKGDSFRVLCTLPQGAQQHSLDGQRSNFAITRLSRAPGYSRAPDLEI
jgi:hypothetical protein